MSCNAIVHMAAKRSVCAALISVSALGSAACRAEPDEVPEVAEIEIEPGEKVVGLEPELVLGPGDVGDMFLVNGWVAGKPLVSRGFFLLTEWNRRIFVASVEPVTAGSPVRVVGILFAVELDALEDWRGDAFEGGMQVGWDFDESYYLNAIMVESLPADSLNEPQP